MESKQTKDLPLSNLINVIFVSVCENMNEERKQDPTQTNPEQPTTRSASEQVLLDSGCYQVLMNAAEQKSNMVQAAVKY